MIRPAPLTTGDKVAIIAPSSPVSEKTLELSAESIRYLGLQPVIFPSCKSCHGYLAGRDDLRASDIHAAFADTQLKGIFCLRGGYGATRLLPLLDLELIRKNPKVFVGYSDITALHLAFNQHCGFITFHAPMPNTGYAKMDEFSTKSLWDNLFSAHLAGPVSNPPGQPIEMIFPGTTKGPITGGNLSLLQGTLGSPFEVDTKNKILFIEEVGEMPYRLDRALTALMLAGKLRDCAGIILGTFAECDDIFQGGSDIGGNSLSLMQIFDELIRPLQKPTILNFRAGHGYPQSTIPMGTVTKLNATDGTIEFL